MLLVGEPNVQQDDARVHRQAHLFPITGHDLASIGWQAGLECCCGCQRQPAAQQGPSVYRSTAAVC